MMFLISSSVVAALEDLGEALEVDNIFNLILEEEVHLVEEDLLEEAHSVEDFSRDINSNNLEKKSQTYFKIQVNKFHNFSLTIHIIKMLSSLILDQFSIFTEDRKYG